MIITALCLAGVCIAQLVLFWWTLRTHAVERASLLDRIQAPEAVRLAAFESQPEVGREFPTPEEVIPPSSWDDDLSLIPEDDTP